MSSRSQQDDAILRAYRAAGAQIALSMAFVADVKDWSPSVMMHACMQAPYTVTVRSSQYDAILNAYNAAPTGNMTNGTATMQVTNSALGLAADSSTSANVTFTVSASSQVKALAVQFTGNWSQCNLVQLAELAALAVQAPTL